MRILTTYPHAPFGGGSQTYCFNLAAEMGRSLKVGVLLPDGESVELGSARKFDWHLAHRVMAASNTAWPNARHYLRLDEAERREYCDSLARGARHAIEAFAPDVIHAHFLLPAGWISAKEGAERGIPTVVTSHGIDVTLSSSDSYYREGTAECLRTSSPEIVGVSPDHVEWIRCTFDGWVGSAQLRCIPGGVDLRTFHPSRDLKDRASPYFLFVGRFEDRKGIDVLLRAARSVPARLVVIGDGWERDRLVALARKLELDNVEFRDFVSSSERGTLAAAYAGALATIVPSLDRRETLCFVALESLACGTPVIASNVGGLPFVLGGGTSGLLVPSGDCEALATAMNRLLSDVGMARALGEAGRARVEARFGWAQISAEYGQLFESIAR